MEQLSRTFTKSIKISCNSVFVLKEACYSKLNVCYIPPGTRVCVCPVIVTLLGTPNSSAGLLNPGGDKSNFSGLER